MSIFYLLPCWQQAAATEAASQSAVCCHVDLAPPRPLSLEQIASQEIKNCHSESERRLRRQKTDKALYWTQGNWKMQ